MTAPGTYAEYCAAITADPEDDGLRQRFAEFWRPFGAPLSRFVELQLERAQRRRSKRDHAAPTSEEDKLLAAHGAEWAHTIRQYSREQVFYRGFVAEMTVEPFLFLEQGDYLFKLAPLRHLAFHRPKAEGGDFPLAEIMASPLLARLDSLGLANLGLGDADMTVVAASSQLKRCVYLDLSNNDLTARGFEHLAAGPLTRKLLRIARDPGFRNNYHPGESIQLTPGTDGMWTSGPPSSQPAVMTPEGVAIERKHGYVPWLHLESMMVDRFDARWLLEHGQLPARPAGSPV